MTALEHAKHFVRHQAAGTALAIVPLALAAPASAAVILNPGDVSAPGAITVGSPTFEALPHGGIKFHGTATYELTPESGSGYSGFITLELAGTGSGILDMAFIPAHFDYSVVPGTGSSISSSIEFFINGASVGSASGEGSPSADLALSGWSPGAALTSWGVRLNAVVQSETSTITLSVPDNSIAITPGPPVTAVPEPGSLLLLSTGAGILARLQRRRRRRCAPM